MKKRLIALAICLCIIMSVIAPGLAAVRGANDAFVMLDGAQTTAVELLQNDQLALTAGIDADSYQWQILAVEELDLWVSIHGETENYCTLTYGKVFNMLNASGEAHVRFVAEAAGEVFTSNSVAVTIIPEVEDAPMVQGAALMLQAPMPANLEADPSETEPKGEGTSGIMPADMPLTHTITINYVYSDGSQAAMPYVAQVAAGSSFEKSVASPAVQGYAPDAEHETVEFNLENISADVTETVYYYPAAVNYTVNYYVQNIEDDQYTLDSSETLQGYTESPVDFIPPNREGEGFYCLPFERAEIAADGSTVINVYYDRYYYLVNFDLDGGYGVEPIYARVGTPISVGTPTRAGYTFTGWDKTLPMTVPVGNSTYKAIWSSGSGVQYTVVYWLENANDKNYSFHSSKTETATAGATVTVTSAQAPAVTHFAYESADTVTVAGDGSTVLNVYYSRNEYTLTFRERTCSGGIFHQHKESCYAIRKTITAKYQADISGEFPIEGCEGYWWDDKDNTVYSSNVVSLDVMPGANVVFNGSYEGEGATIYYYVETINSAAGVRDYNGKSFDLYKAIPTAYSGYLTIDEEFHPIEGFSRYGSDPQFGSNGRATIKEKNYMYYSRNSYDLKFYNYNAYVGNAKQVQYEASLTGEYFVPSYPAGLEPGAYVFDGWYATPECYDVSKVDFATATMPASALTLYAKWVPITHTVDVYLDNTLAAEKKLGATQTVSHNGTATEPDESVVKNGDYSFVGWFYMDNGSEKAFSFDMPVKKDLTVYAKWSSSVLTQYTIKYVTIVDGNEVEIADRTTGSSLHGYSKTFEAKYGSELYSLYQSGYYPAANSHTIEIDLESENTYTFYYTAKSEVSYTVKYTYADTGLEAAPPKTVSTSNAVVTETFVQVNGYMPDAYQKRLILTSDPNENVIEFIYSKDDTHAYYKVTHFVQTVAGGNNYTEHQSYQQIGTQGNTITETPLNIPGFMYNETKSTDSGTLTAGGLELELYYDRISYPYEFRYYVENSTTPVATTKTGNALFQQQVTDTAPTVAGYDVIGSANGSIVIAIEDDVNTADKNVYTFYYREQEIAITYVAVGSGSVSPGSQNLGAVTGVVTGSVPTADEHHRFVGWYTDAECTIPVNAGWVDSNDNKLTPQKENGVYKSATYYAKFEPATFDLTITKTIEGGGTAEQSFIFDINKDGSVVMSITMSPADFSSGTCTKTIYGLQSGSYTVTERDGWSWKYECTASDGNVSDTDTTATFTNERKSDVYWLGDAALVSNVYSKKTKGEG